VTRGRILLAITAVVALAGVLAWWALSVSGAGRLGAGRDARAPEGERIRVEVLNATRTRGLARRATRHLRDRGFDVVGMGNADAPLDSTLVLDRSGHPEWARLVAEALGGAHVESRPDSSRYLDVTVLIGASWTPSAEPFDP
jgi:hypothetical protein